jgi:hypothetical protein
MRVRIKLHQFPGDLPKALKIRMLESRVPFQAFPWQWIGPNAIRAFRRMRQLRERSTFKRQSERLIEEQSEEE